MSVKNWELRVWSPVGAGPRVIGRDESFIRSSGLRMQLTPEGDCREASFEARGDGLGIQPLDCVQFVYGGIPLFYGEVRTGGNIRDRFGQRYTLRSLKQRLGEVTLSGGFTAPQQPAHLTVQAILKDVANQLYGTILFDEALCPDLGFDLAPVRASNHQTALALLEKIAEAGKAFGVTAVFGVRPDRKFFCRAADIGALELTQGELTGATHFTEPVAEVVCTAVLWYLMQAGTGASMTWITHLSRAPEADLYGERVRLVTLSQGLDFLENGTLEGEYADVVRSSGADYQPLPEDATRALMDGWGYPTASGAVQPAPVVKVSVGGGPIIPVDPNSDGAPAEGEPTGETFANNGANSGGVRTEDEKNPVEGLGRPAIVTGEAPRFAARFRLRPKGGLDGHGPIAMYINASALSEGLGKIIVARPEILTEKPPPFVPPPYTRNLADLGPLAKYLSSFFGMFNLGPNWSADQLEQLKRAAYIAWQHSLFTYVRDFQRIGGTADHTLSEFVGIVPVSAGQVVYLQAEDGNASAPAQITVYEARPLVASSKLDRIAEYYYKTPASEPADIESRVFRTPEQLAKYVRLGDYQSIVDAWEYRLSAARGMTLGCLTGQAEDPAALAQAELIKQRDGQAVITAITAGGG